VKEVTHPIRTTARAAKALCALAALTALLAALPYALIRFVGWPLPRTMPTWSGIQHALTHQITGPTLYIDTLACLLWLCWTLLALSFLIELLAALARTPAPRVPGLGPGQFLAAALITALGLSVAARPASAATTSHLPAHLTAATAPVQPETASLTAVASSAARADTETVHTVVPGDSLWSIAAQDLGNGKDWPRLYALNAGAPQPDGQSLRNPDLIEPGWTLRIVPDAAPASAVTSAPTPATPHSTTHLPATAPDTPSMTASTPETTPTPQPRNTSAAPRPTTADTGQTTVHTPGSVNATPHRPPVARADAPGWIALAEGGALSAAVLAALGLALRRARRRQRWSDTCYWPRPGERPPTAPLTIPLPLHPAPRPALPEQDATEQLAELDAYGAPDETESSRPHDITTAGITGVAGIAAPTRGGTHEQPEPESPQEPADPEGGAHQTTVSVPLAVAGSRTLTLDEIGPALALTGPGALAAARAIAAAALATATPDTAGARLLIARRYAALLLEQPDGELAGPLADVHEIELADDSARALSYLEQYVTHRTRLLDQHDCQRLERLPDDDGDQHPPAILLALARPELTARLTATLAAGADLRVHAVLLGEHPATPTWHIDATGKATGAGLPQDATAFTLPAPALRAAITLLANSTGHGLHNPTPITPPDPHGPLAAPSWKPDPEHLPSPAAIAHPPSAEPDAAGQPPVGTHERSGSAPQNTAPDAPPATRASSTREHAAAHTETAGSAADRVAAITNAFKSAPVRVKVLGVHTISTPSGDVDGKMRHDSWRLAAYLAVHHRRAQHTDDLAALWPDHGDQDLRTALKHALYTLRKVLRDKSTDNAGHGRFALHITNVNNRYAFNPQLVAIDLAAFGQLRALAAETRDIAERTAAAKAALALYDGELLAGLDEEWMLAPRAMARRDALATATLLAQLADRADDPETALTWWERALHIDDNEEVYRQIITTQTRLGRRADALATRDLLIARLDADGASPSPETRALLAHTLTRRPTPTATGAGPDIRRPTRPATSAT
jgi:DNA-binding SARP family transcriptional activator/LysM repeat protein